MTPLAFASAALIAVGAALPAIAVAEDVGQHPAVFAPRSLPGVNPNTFVVGHPASPRNRLVHANAPHPAVLTWAAAQAAGRPVDGNAFLVQPPASVRWTLAPAADSAVAASRPAAAGAQ